MTIYPNVSIEEWITFHPELQARSTSCRNCGSILTASIPFITKDYYGLCSPECSCGESITGIESMVTRSKREHDSWMSSLGYKE